MRKLHQFSAGEWLRAVPVAHGFKQVRNDLLLKHYVRREAAGLAEFLRAQAHLAGCSVGIVIAFEQPWALQWQLRMAAQNLRSLRLLVFDNSREPEMRARIRAVCDEFGVPYLALPRYRTRHANRSHGMAMSWVWQQVVRPLRPSVFGFLDHDLIPLDAVDPTEALRDQPVYGLINKGNLQHWSLWAGYCFYRFDFAVDRPLNFLYDFSRGLDTGGRNWNPLYRKLHGPGLRFARQEFVPVQPPGMDAPRKIEVLDDAWVHVGGVSYGDNFERKHALFEALLLARSQGTAFEALRAA